MSQVRPQQAARRSRQPVLVSASADSNRREALAFSAGALLLALTGAPGMSVIVIAVYILRSFALTKPYFAILLYKAVEN